jgi:hypothetical protein
MSDDELLHYEDIPLAQTIRVVHRSGCQSREASYVLSPTIDPQQGVKKLKMRVICRTCGPCLIVALVKRPDPDDRTAIVEGSTFIASMPSRPHPPLDPTAN